MNPSSEKQLTSKLISTHCAFLVQVEMTSHDVDDDSGPQEYQKIGGVKPILWVYSASSPNGNRVNVLLLKFLWGLVLGLGSLWNLAF